MGFAATLGRAMLDAAPGQARVEAAAATLGGALLVIGRVESDDVRYEGGFDLGTVVVAGDGGRVNLHVYNEYMAADRGGERLWTFPDMLGSLDPRSGDPIAIDEMPPGREVAVVAGRAPPSGGRRRHRPGRVPGGGREAGRAPRA